VNLGVAKDQRLSLNPSQISGACGRLMCCLRYEHEFYVQSRKRFPKEGRIVRTSVGEEKIIANDIFRERVTLRGPDGEQRILPLQTLRDEMAALGGALPAIANAEPETATPDSDAYAAGEELVLESLAAHETKQSSRREKREGPPRPRRQPAAAVSRAPEASDAPRSAASEATAPDAETQGEADAEAQKRPHRRRGRRGGRRNRPSGGTK
jgi:hypothetical protein